MKCRKVVKDAENNRYNIVYFGSVGLQQPYAIIFKLNGNYIIHDIQTLEGIITNKNNSKLYISDNDSSYVQITEVNIAAQTLSYTVSGFEDTDINLTAYYYTKSMFESDTQKSSIIKQYPLNHEGGTITFDILQMSKKWKNDGSQDSYAEKQEATASSLIQRLSIIQGELWYNISYGLPLLSKVKDKFIYDSIIMNIILKHKDVREIVSFESKINNTSFSHGTYFFNCTVDTIYNNLITFSSSQLI